MRVSKTVNGEETERYYYQGNNLVGIWRSTANHMQFVYDQTGVCGTWYDGQLYSFIKNVFGDITGIIAGDGTLTALYEYDAWGNCKVLNSDGTENIAPAFIGNINPFRYRGYYYDTETGFYYLQTRYYDPVVCRFLTPDSTDYLEPTTFGGLNLYAYCYNNPISYCDPSGHFIISALIIGAIIGAAIGFGIATYIDYQDDGEIFNGSVKWYDYLGATVLGGAIGAGIGAGIGYIAPQIGSALSSFASTSFSLGGGLSLSASGAVTMSAGLTITEAQVLVGVGILSNILFMGNPFTPNPNDTAKRHRTTKNGKSNWDKHSGRRSGGPEKKDSRMKYHKWKRMKGFPFFPFLYFIYELFDEE